MAAGQEEAKRKLLKIYTNGTYMTPDFLKGFKYMSPTDPRYARIMELLREKCRLYPFSTNTVGWPIIFQLECALLSEDFKFDCLPEIIYIFKELTVSLFWKKDLPEHFKKLSEEGTTLGE